MNTANPDGSNRARALRDHHFELLRPVLRNESSQLKGVADQIKNTGHVSAMIERQAKTVPADLIWPDIMSQDLRNHFPDYDNKKRELRAQVEAQDREFQLTMSRLEDQKPVTDLEPYWKEMLAFAFVERSLGHGDVMKLRVSEGGYNFESPRGTIGGSGQPPVDIVAAVRVFDSINADANLAPHIASMKRREEVIVNAAQDLSKQAAFLAEGVVLPGMCSFLKKVD